MARDRRHEDDDPTRQLERLRARPDDTVQLPVVGAGEEVGVAEDLPQRRRRPGPGVLIGCGLVALALVAGGVAAVGPVHDALTASPQRSGGPSQPTGSSRSDAPAGSGTSASSAPAESSEPAQPSGDDSTSAPAGPAGGPRAGGGAGGGAGGSAAPKPPAGRPSPPAGAPSEPAPADGGPGGQAPGDGGPAAP